MRLPFALVLAAGLVAADPAGEWPRFRGPAGDGASTETAWTHTWAGGAPVRLWTAQVGAGFSSVAISGGLLITQGNEKNEDVIRALDAATGAPRWQFRYACALQANGYPGGTSATPTIADGAVYTVSKPGHVHCLDAATGAVRWSKELLRDAQIKPPNWGFSGSPLVDGPRLVLNAGKAGVALDRATGAVLWSNGAGACGYASPVPFTVAGRRCLALFGGDTLRGVDAERGTELWSFPWKTSFGENTPDPVADGPALFVSTGHGLGSTLIDCTDGQPPTVRWANKAYGTHLVSAVHTKGAYFGSYGRVNRPDGGLFCLDAATGDLRWKQDTVRAAMLLAGDRLIALTLKGELVVIAADPTAFRELARCQALSGTCWTAPVLSAGRLYLRSGTGELACFDVAMR